MEIHNIRGIPNLDIQPDGENLVICGPNGSGKSAVVDAIDFLLSGSMARLTGEGTGDIRLNTYGKHIKSSTKDVWVRAEIELPGIGPVTIERHINNPSNLLCVPKTAKEQMTAIEDYAKLGQHIVTRREIIHFILSKPSNRADMMSRFLDLSVVEKYRGGLIGAKNKLARDLEIKSGVVASTKLQVMSTTGEEYDESKMFQTINSKRELLGALPLAVNASDILTGVESPVQQAMSRPDELGEIQETVERIISMIRPQSLSAIQKSDKALRANLAKAKLIPDFERVIETRKLVNLGMTLLGSDGSCPLCDTEWKPNLLKAHLSRKDDGLRVAGSLSDEIIQLRNYIVGEIRNLIPETETLLAISKLAGTQRESTELSHWIQNLRTLAEHLDDVFHKYAESRQRSDEIGKLFTSGREKESIARIQESVEEKYPKPTVLEEAFAFLLQLKENLGSLYMAAQDEMKYIRDLDTAKTVVNIFEKAMKNQLEDLYERICDRFSEIYKLLHGPDEQNFDACFTRDGPSLRIETRFYDQGRHPPAALHSEGHQDSMGLAMHLSIREYLTKGNLSLLVFDDVMMSIDASHRKDVCKLLRELSSETQFIITTHDKTWAHHLRSEGVVRKSRMLEFYGWDLDTGPKVRAGVDMWDRIQAELADDDIVAAAGRLRNGLEQFFEDICDSIVGPVGYKSNGLYDLGDYLPSAVGKIRKLLGKAQRKETSQGHAEKASSAQKLLESIADAYMKTNAEGWGMHRSLHFNNWANISSSELGDVVDAFRVLCKLFVCGSCESKIMLMKQNHKSVALRCSCGELDWSL